MWLHQPRKTTVVIHLTATSEALSFGDSKRPIGRFRRIRPFVSPKVDGKNWSAAAPREGRLCPHPGSDPDIRLTAIAAIYRRHTRASCVSQTILR